MRLISQDGTIDVPYENVAIVVTGNHIGVESGTGMRYPMANYDSEEKVNKVICDLQDNFHLFSRAILKMPGFGSAGTYFKFPEDDEVKANET